MQLQKPKPVRIPREWESAIQTRIQARRASNFSHYVRLLIEDDIAAAAAPAAAANLGGTPHVRR